VNIVHPYRGDLVIDLVAPDGTAYRLKNSSSVDGADNVVTTFPVNLADERADGAWKLSARDLYRSDAGSINTWTLAL
jgi:subtilisin-like proprotein convertase family protein